MKGDIIATCSLAEHAKRPSDDLGLEHRSPVGQPLPQKSISDIRRFFIGQRFNDFECEAVRAVIAPGLLKTSVWVVAQAQREPDAVLYGVQVQALPEPCLTRTGTANRANSRDVLAFLVFRNRRFPVVALHQAASFPRTFELSAN
jgi:hypothetical protein